MTHSLHPRFRFAFALVGLLTLGSCGPSGSGGGPAGGTGDAPAMAEAEPAPLPATSTVDEGPRPARGLAWVIFGDDTVTAEVARTAEQRAQGLMDREALGEDAGMLFVFESAEERAFWMSNTLIPLDIAYMDPRFRIFTIKPMEPLNEDLVESDGPAQYALEVNQGWFAEHGVTVGAQPEIVFGR